MFFELTEEQLAVQEAAREFAQKELKPGVIERDNKQEYPKEQVRKMAELGFLGMMVSPEYGGGGMDTMSYVLGYGGALQGRQLLLGHHVGQQFLGLLGHRDLWYRNPKG